MPLSRRVCLSLVAALCFIVSASAQKQNPPSCWMEKCGAGVTNCMLDPTCAREYENFFACSMGWGCGLGCVKHCSTPEANNTPMQQLVSCAVNAGCLPNSEFQPMDVQAGAEEEEEDATVPSLRGAGELGVLGNSTGFPEDYFLWDVKNGGCQMIPRTMRCVFPEPAWNISRGTWKVGSCPGQGYNQQRGSARSCEKVQLPPHLSRTQWSK